MPMVVPGRVDRLAHRPRQADDRAEEGVRLRRLEVLDRGCVRARHDQHVPVGERLHVEERDEVLAPGDDLGGDLALHDAAEDAGHRGRLPVTPVVRARAQASTRRGAAFSEAPAWPRPDRARQDGADDGDAGGTRRRARPAPRRP